MFLIPRVCTMMRCCFRMVLAATCLIVISHAEIWQPEVNATWQWQLQWAINTSFSVDMYDVDLFGESIIPTVVLERCLWPTMQFTTTVVVQTTNCVWRIGSVCRCYNQSHRLCCFVFAKHSQYVST